MKILSLNKDTEKKVISESLKVLKKGGVIAYPTESFYALGVNACNEAAMEKLYAIKNRPPEKAMPVIVGNKDILRMIVKSISLEAEKLIKKYWPSPLTLIFWAKADLPELLTGGSGKVAARIPGECFALHLAKAADFPITATSANLSGKPPAQHPEDVIKYFRELIDLIIDGGKTLGGKPSTIVDVTVTPPKVLRKGRIHLGELTYGSM